MQRHAANSMATERLLALPLARGEVWEGAWAVVVAEIDDEQGGFYHPEVALWVEATEGLVVGMEVVLPGDGERALARLLPAVMRRPQAGTPRRPSLVRVRDADMAEQLARKLGPVQVLVTTPSARETASNGKLSL